MKKTLIILTIATLLLSCKEEATSIFDFEVNISRVESHRVWLDIFPTDEFMPYTVDWLPLDEWVELYGSNASVYLQETSDILAVYEPEQLHYAYNEGATMTAIPCDAGTEYVLLIAQVEGTTATALRVEKFRSLDEHLITDFIITPNDISMDSAGYIRVNPMDTVNTYLWDFELKKTVDRDWNGYHSALFYYDMEFYYQFDFFPDIFSKGPDIDSLFTYYNRSELAFGDTICLVAVGYDETGETSLSYMPFWIIWYEGRGGYVTWAAPDGLESHYRGTTTSTTPGVADVPGRRKNGCLFTPKGYAELFDAQSIMHDARGARVRAR